MRTTEKHIRRGYKRNYQIIQAIIAEYQQATGKDLSIVNNLHVKMTCQPMPKSYKKVQGVSDE